MRVRFGLIVIAAAGAVWMSGSASHASVDVGAYDVAAAAADVAQGDSDGDGESDTDRRLIDRSSTERVDSVLIALFSIAGAMALMLLAFLWHTSPRRRLRLARRRSSRMYGSSEDASSPDTIGASKGSSV